MKQDMLAKENWPAWLSDTTALAIGGALVLFYMLAWWRIFSRAGYHGAVSLLMLIPVVNVVMFFWLGFGPWPAANELRRLRKMDDAVSSAQQRYSRAS
jgi:hypothetical protein